MVARQASRGKTSQWFKRETYFILEKVKASDYGVHGEQDAETPKSQNDPYNISFVEGRAVT